MSGAPDRGISTRLASPSLTSGFESDQLADQTLSRRDASTRYKAFLRFYAVCRAAGDFNARA